MGVQQVEYKTSPKVTIKMQRERVRSANMMVQEVNKTQQKKAHNDIGVWVSKNSDAISKEVYV